MLICTSKSPKHWTLVTLSHSTNVNSTTMRHARKLYFISRSSESCCKNHMLSSFHKLSNESPPPPFPCSNIWLPGHRSDGPLRAETSWPNNSSEEESTWPEFEGTNWNSADDESEEVPLGHGPVPSPESEPCNDPFWRRRGPVPFGFGSRDWDAG